MDKIKCEQLTLQEKVEAIDHIIKNSIERKITKTHKELMGQYFTPGNVIDMMLEILKPVPSEVIVDPSSGCGSILIHAHSYIYQRYKVKARTIMGIELDKTLIDVSNTLHKQLGFRSTIQNEDTLKKDDLDEKVDIIIGNPPFGKKMIINNPDGQAKKTERVEVLFLEKCVKMLRYGGRMGLVLPDGVLGNEGNSGMRKWLLQEGKILAVVDLPVETFMPFTSVKTSVLFFEKTKVLTSDYRIFMAIAETCGHDKRGNTILTDDVSQIAKEYDHWNTSNTQ